MPMRSQAQRRLLWAKHPDVAREFEDATPKGKKLPEKVKHAFDLGAAEALERFGLKRAAEEIRLKIPAREFHGWDAAFKGKSAAGAKRAAEGDANDLAGALSSLPAPNSPLAQIAAKDPLDRSTAWGAPSNLAGGDTANRLSDMGQNTGFGGV